MKGVPISDADRAEIRKLDDLGVPIKEIAYEVGCSVASVYNVLKDPDYWAYGPWVF